MKATERETVKLIGQAMGAGISVSCIAQHLGISRAMVYKLIKENP